MKSNNVGTSGSNNLIQVGKAGEDAKEGFG
jgi:hypothetical protein